MSINYNRMDLITGIISLVILLGSLSRILIPLIQGRPPTFGFSTTFAFFLGLFGSIMSLAKDWSWWWTVPLGFISVSLIGMIITQVFSLGIRAVFFNKFIKLNSILSVILILTSIPGIKNLIAPNLTLGAIIPAIIVSIAMLIISIGLGLGDGNFILGMLTIGNAFVNFGKFLWKNRGKSFVSLISIIYAIVYFSITIPQMYQWFTGTAPTSKVTLGALNVVGLFLAIVFGVAFLSATMTNLPNSMPFRTRIRQIFIGELPMKMFKILSVIALMIGLCILLFVLGGQEFPYTVITLIIQIICVLAVLFGVFRYVINNPRLLASIKNNIFIRLLFTIIMIIPCMLVYLTQGVVSTAKAATAAAGKSASFAEKVQFIAPPKMVLMIFAAEILTVSAYIFLPMFRKWIYTFTPGGGEYNIDTDEKVEAIQSAIIEERKKLYNDITIGTAPLNNIDWEKVSSEKMTQDQWDTNQLLIAYLTTLGYKESYGILRDNKLTTGVLGNPITITQAVKFIQTPGRVDGIITDISNINIWKNKLVLAQKDIDDGGPSDSMILNNKPIYINKISLFVVNSKIGSYENLKRNELNHNYNYGLSSWIFLIAQPPSYGAGYSKFTKVLDYAGKPTILYNPESNTLKITTNVHKKDSTIDEKTFDTKTIYKTTKIPLQKWNNIVVNYVGGILDVFINKKLVASVSNLIPYMSDDNIYIGDNPGISGSVANVTYFSRPISKRKISFFYNNLVNKDPPIV